MKLLHTALLLGAVTFAAGRMDPALSLQKLTRAYPSKGASASIFRNEEPSGKHDKPEDVNSGPGKGPLIGIIGQPCESCPSRMYINAAYAKFIQMAGGRAVPIRYYDNKDELRRVFNSINGLIWPGGLTWLYQDEPYLWTARQLFQWAMEENDKGDVFPIWGTCLGFQMLHMLMGDVLRDELLIPTDSVEHATTLNFTEAGLKSKLLGTLDERLISALGDPAKNISMENHEYGILPRRYVDFPSLDKELSIVTTTKDRNGIEYVSTVEAKRYPFFGTQWHPEKPPFEFNIASTPHTPEAIYVSQHVANVFVGFARMSQHKPKSNDELIDLLLDREQPISIYDDSSIQTADNYDGPELSYYLDPWDEPPPPSADLAKMKPHDAQLCREDLDSPFVPCDKIRPKEKGGKKKAKGGAKKEKKPRAGKLRGTAAWAEDMGLL